MHCVIVAEVARDYQRSEVSAVCETPELCLLQRFLFEGTHCLGLY